MLTEEQVRNAISQSIDYWIEHQDAFPETLLAKATASIMSLLAASAPTSGAPVGVAEGWNLASEWVRNNYQDWMTVDELCNALLAAKGK